METAWNLSPPLTYQRRRPEETLLYQVIQNNILTVLQRIEECGTNLPKYVKDEFFKFLDCGILSKGFVRVHCGDCKQDKLVAFSCKGRGICPSCGGRRMSQTATNLVDNVFPRVPVRQWVLSVPFPIRYLMAFNSKILNQILSIFIRTISRFYTKQAKGLCLKNPTPSAVTFVQRFGSSCNLNIHFHTIFVDGVFYEKRPGEIKFFRTSPLADEEVNELALKLKKKILRALRKGGHFREHEDEGETPEDQVEQNPLLAKIFGASIMNRIGLGPYEGGPMFRVGNDQQVRWRPAVGTRLSNIDGFSLHANVTIPAHQRQELEKLLRYTARPALANSRISEAGDGQILLELKKQFNDGTTHLRFTPEQFIEKLVAIIPPPRSNLVRYHGGFAPNSPLRKKIVPEKKINNELQNPNSLDGPKPFAYWIFWAETQKRGPSETKTGPLDLIISGVEGRIGHIEGFPIPCHFS